MDDFKLERLLILTCGNFQGCMLKREQGTSLLNGLYPTMQSSFLLHGELYLETTIPKSYSVHGI